VSAPVVHPFIIAKPNVFVTRCFAHLKRVGWPRPLFSSCFMVRRPIISLPMLLRCLAIVALFISFALPVQAKMNIVRPCPTQTTLMVCTIEAATQSSSPRLQVEQNCSGKCLSVPVSERVMRETDPQNSAFLATCDVLTGWQAEGIDRPPKGCWI
jgi:hypothetical protein